MSDDEKYQSNLFLFHKNVKDILLPCHDDEFLYSTHVSEVTCEVDNLVAGTVVQFNVLASNGVGESKPSDTSPMYHVIGERDINKFKNKQVIPDRPRQPKKPWFQEFTVQSCTLNWEPPDSDGGAEITRYIIQRRENHGDWKAYNQFLPKVQVSVFFLS